MKLLPKLWFTYLLIVGICNVCSTENKYFISPSKMRATFIQSLAFCRRFGMTLLTIPTEEKNSDMYNHLARLNETHEWYWTSGIFQNNSMTREWYWLEGDRKVEYTDWRQNDVPIEPNYYSDSDNCIRWGLYEVSNAANGLWRADDCGSSRRFICEKPYSNEIAGGDHIGGN